MLSAEGTIRTYSGLEINVFNPTPEMICIEDIAHALSNICRFGGHVNEFYSVAQHSIHVFELAEEEDKLLALLHDASEAYLYDMPTPIKKELPEYKKAEHKLMLVIAEKFGFDWPMNERIEIIDNKMLHWEFKQLMLKEPGAIVCLNPIIAKHQFIKLFNLYHKKHGKKQN